MTSYVQFLLWGAGKGWFAHFNISWSVLKCTIANCVCVLKCTLCTWFFKNTILFLKYLKGIMCIVKLVITIQKVFGIYPTPEEFLTNTRLCLFWNKNIKDEQSMLLVRKFNQYTQNTSKITFLKYRNLCRFFIFHSMIVFYFFS